MTCPSNEDAAHCPSVCSTYKVIHKEYSSAKVVVIYLQSKSHEIIKTAYTSWLNDKFLFTF